MKPLPLPRFWTVTALVAALGWAVDSRADEGAWLAPLASQSLLLDVTRGPEFIVAVGERGHILTSDQGNQWQQVPAPATETLTAVDILSSGLGFAVGHDAVILRTLDGGGTWDRVFSEPEQDRPFLDVKVVDETRVVAIGAYGYYLESLDGGNSWQERVLDAQPLVTPSGDADVLFDDYHLNALEISASGRWYIAGESGTVYRSDDQGLTWFLLPSPYHGSFYGLLTVDGDKLFVFGLEGRLFQSKDAGETWTQVETGTDAILSYGLTASKGNNIVLGYAGTVLSGLAVDETPRLYQDRSRVSVTAGLVLSKDRLLVVGDRGVSTIVNGSGRPGASLE